MSFRNLISGQIQVALYDPNFNSDRLRVGVGSGRIGSNLGQPHNLCFYRSFSINQNLGRVWILEIRAEIGLTRIWFEFGSGLRNSDRVIFGLIQTHPVRSTCLPVPTYEQRDLWLIPSCRVVQTDYEHDSRARWPSQKLGQASYIPT